MVTNGSIETEEEILELKAAVWACAHLGTSESGVALLESAQVVEALVRIASFSTILTLRGTAFFALNLVAVTTAGVDILARFGKIYFEVYLLEIKSWFIYRVVSFRLGFHQTTPWRTMACVG